MLAVQNDAEVTRSLVRSTNQSDGSSIQTRPNAGQTLWSFYECNICPCHQVLANYLIRLMEKKKIAMVYLFLFTFRTDTLQTEGSRTPVWGLALILDTKLNLFLQRTQFS